MNIQLPSERELREPHQMVDRILQKAQNDVPPRRLRITPAISVAVAAAITLTATVLGITAASRDQPEVGQGPGVTATPQPPTPAQPSAVTSVGATVTFPDLTVTVRSANQIQLNNRPADEYTILVTTCLPNLPAGNRTGRRLRADSFTLNTGSATITVDDPIRMPIPLPTTYPADGNFKAGQCISGVIPFGVDHRSTVVSIDYTNSSGDTASWIP